MSTPSFQFRHTVGEKTFGFKDLKELMAKATPARSGDRLAGVAADSAEERAIAQMTLADVPLKQFLEDLLIPYEDDEITRLIIDEHDKAAFAPISHLTVGGFRDWLLSDLASPSVLKGIRAGVTPEMAAAVSKIMRNQDLILVAKKCHVTTAFRNTIGLPGHLSTRLQPNHPTDDLTGIAASMLDGLLYANGDAVIGIMDRKTPMIETYKAVILFVASDLVRVALLVAFPAITLFLVQW